MLGEGKDISDVCRTLRSQRQASDRYPHRTRRCLSSREPGGIQADNVFIVRTGDGARRADGVADDRELVDDITDTHSNKTREGWGQGVANIVTGFFGGMGGCAVIGQTMINVKVSGAHTRISTFLAGVFLLILVVGLGGLVAKIPMAALVAVMIMVSVGTFDWHSIAPKTLRRMPIAETTVTVAVTVATDNLAIGVVVGVLTAMVAFAHRVAHFTEVAPVPEHVAADGPYEPGTRVDKVRGELFFASSNDLVYQFDYIGDPAHIVIDMSDTHIWDASTVEIIGLNSASESRHDRLSGHLAGAH